MKDLDADAQQFVGCGVWIVCIAIAFLIVRYTLKYY